MKKVLFTGGKGLLGKYFLKNIPKDYFVLATYLRNKEDEDKKKNVEYMRLDITDKSDVKKVLNDYKPEIIVHAASLGNVDYCEQYRKEAWETNVGGTINIADGAKKINASLLYLSSNAIFDGVNPLFSEKSKPNPVDYYGKTKFEAEKEIKKRNINYAIIRLMTMYGWNNEKERLNPVSWLIQRLKNGEEVKIVNDIYNNYLYANDAASVIWKIILKDKVNEVYNIAGSECITRFDLALKVAKVFNLDKKLITPVSSDYFSNIAPRPQNTCFDIGKIITTLDVRPVGILEGLRLMKNEKN